MNLPMPEPVIARNLFYLDPQPDVRSPAAEMVERARAGDNVAFTEIYRSFAPMVHGIVLARVPFDEVGDIVQDVFLTAYGKLGGLRDADALGGWLAAIARNHATEFYRRTKPTIELLEHSAVSLRPEREAAEILDAIRSLPDSYRETLILRLVEGMSGNEIAERTGITPQSVRVNLHRGMQMLRQKLGISTKTK